jgi:superfamily II DNA helicase RecQ
MKEARQVKDSFARKNLHYHVVHRQDHLPYITRLLIKNKGAAIVYVHTFEISRVSQLVDPKV